MTPAWLRSFRSRLLEPHAFARLEPLLQDLHLAARRLRRAPSFTAVAALTLALGIGANVALFAVVDAVLLRPLPYPQPEQLLSLFETHVPGGGRDRPATVANLADYAVPSLEGLSAYGFRSKDLTGAGTPETLAGVIVGASYFEVPLDPLTFATVPLCLGAIAAAATLVPALRAGRVDPITALRCE